MQPRIPKAIFWNSLAIKPTAMATIALIIKPTRARMIPNTEVSLSSSKTEKIPEEEESKMAQ
jgi:hypothetical protein